MERLSHALLLGGPEGLGKRDFAATAARTLLCEQGSQGAPCGQCKSCRLWDARVHPDLFLAQPLEPGKPIVVDRIRALIEFLYLKPHTAARKVAIVSPAETLNLSAANSLLKVLEEPPDDSYLLLVTDHPERLLPTLRSRCQRLDFVAPPRLAARAWLSERKAVEGVDIALEFASGAPLRALALLEGDFSKQARQWAADLDGLLRSQIDPPTVAARWKKADGALALEWLQRWVAALVRLKMGAASALDLEITPQLQAQAKVLDLTVLFRFADVLGEARKLVSEPVDELLLLEDTLIRWVQLLKRL